jgi:hypothetical protein
VTGNLTQRSKLSFSYTRILRKHVFLVVTFCIPAVIIGCGSTSEKIPTSGTPPADSASSETAPESSITPDQATTPRNSSCSVDNLSVLVPQSPNVVASAGSACSPKLPYVAFSALSGASVNDANTIYSLSLFDFDYCAFSSQYNFWPREAFSVVSVSLIDPAASSGTAPSAGTYTVGASSGLSVYTSKPSSADSRWAFLGTGATSSSSATGATTICDKRNSAVVSGTVTLTGGLQGVSTASNGFVKGITGSLSLELENGQTVSGSFSTGACSGSYSPVSDEAEISACSCSLSTPN